MGSFFASVQHKRKTGKRNMKILFKAMYSILKGKNDHFPAFTFSPRFFTYQSTASVKPLLRSWVG